MPTLSVFLDVPSANVAEDQLLNDYIQDENPNKVYLSHRACKTNEGQNWISPVVQKTLLQLISDPTLNHEYLPALGLKEFNRVVTELIVGRNSPAILNNRAGAVHTVGGTGAIRLGAEFLNMWHHGSQKVYILWSQLDFHGHIFESLGFSLCLYCYWDYERMHLDTGKFMETVEHAPEGSIFVLHNSESMGLTQEQWKTVAAMMKKRIFPFFDDPHQGFISGNLDQDVWALRYFVDNGFEIFCSQTFTKNFGLYDERVGNLIVVTLSSQVMLKIRSQLEERAKCLWSSPPDLGARIITTVLNNPALRAEWKTSLKALVETIMLTREKLKEKLRLLGTPGSWEHLTCHEGTHSLLGLSPVQIDYLVKKKHIYLLRNGKVNLTCINSHNLDYVSQSINEAVLAYPHRSYPRCSFSAPEKMI
ncbi:putative aspartate aminotransferase, cytoplasmic 2 isoform X2 [Tachyglossus aculeatus]|uniref:putative aspartate aminotransferase, cytoplasmic 2 isoform X2 n=1 Tax=Tachyglossus aculeatus TaxID=9261 RepID=UPI0018F45072|nr:putative aspartate aminotransferase, cytoplasmic 2 isoform X2 [Tachyglossus aculeatus]